MLHTVAAMLLFAAAPATADAVEDAPAYPTAGFRRPEMVVKNCVQDAIRLPRDLKQFVTGPVTVKFAVGNNGEISRFEMMTTGLPERIGQIIEQAVRGCEWKPGADVQGRTIPLWVIMPLRFAR